MAKNYSSSFKEKINSTSGEAPLTLLEITHVDLALPVRVCNDAQDLTSNGNVFTALSFRIAMPDDLHNQLPRARLAIDNVGRELTQWLDASKGGRGAQVRVMHVMRGAPNTIEFDITMDLMNVRQGPLEITGELGFDNTLNIAALPITYRPDNAPGLF